ncbi:MAG: CPBP family intramembrane metalloprotease [Tissierellales bacterium]|jgi:membrane protease YdiL (CAAX protease family)|nr:CPBP family intramembrane metalloprotease [Tissierellales bacterium]
MEKGTKKIITFLLLAVALVIYPFYNVISSGSIYGNEGYVFFVMWVPTIAAVVTKLIWDRNLRGFGLGIGKAKYTLVAYMLPLIAGIIVYGSVWTIGIGGVNFEWIRIDGAYDLFKFLIMGVIMSSISAMGEEIGWRGFLVPELFKKYSFFKTSIIMGLIWNIYHYPVLLFSDYNNGVSVLSSLVFFTLSIFGVCFIATYLRIKSGSVWPAIILHASHNYFVQAVFDPMTIDRGMTKFFTTEFGLGLALVYVIMGIYFWKKGKRLDIN